MAKPDRSLAKHSATERKRRHVPLEVERAIGNLALRGFTPIQIYRHLEEKEEFKGKLPSLRTVQTIVKQNLPRDPSEPWSLADSKRGDVPSVLETLAAVIEQTEGRITSLSVAQAEWIARIDSAAPDIDPWDRFLVTVMYQKLAETDGSTKDLDAFLAFAPWRGNEALIRYNKAFQSGYIQAYYAMRDGALWRVGGGSPYLTADSMKGVSNGTR